MSCGTFKCGLRRFDGHGTSSFRPVNPEKIRQFNVSVEAMMAERARQDAGIFTTNSSSHSNYVPQNITSFHEMAIPSGATFYSLSDANVSHPQDLPQSLLQIENKPRPDKKE